MIWTNWDPLKEVIVGNCPTVAVRNNLAEILQETKEDLDNLAKTILMLCSVVWGVVIGFCIYKEPLFCLGVFVGITTIFVVFWSIGRVLKSYGYD